MTKPSYIPALRFRSLTPYFDRVVSWTLREDHFRGLLLDQAQIEPGMRVVDVGCGTGTLALLLKERCPQAEVIGIDVDPDALSIAREKARKAGVEIELRESRAWEAKFDPASVDRVLSSLVFHHLRTEEKRRTLECSRRWLKANGEVHIADWGRAANGLMRVAFLSVQLLDGFETTAENVQQGLVPAMREAGFSTARETHREMTPLGTLSLYRA